MVLKINKHLLRLFLQLKIIWGLVVLNHFSAFFHPFFPFYKWEVAEAGVQPASERGCKYFPF